VFEPMSMQAWAMRAGGRGRTVVLSLS